MHTSANKIHSLIAKSVPQHEDWRLITAVLAMAAGCIVVFGVNASLPDSEFLIALSAASMLGMFFVPRDKRTALVPVGMFIVGLTVSQLRLEQLSPERIDREVFVSLTGVVERLEYRTDRPVRLTLEVQAADKEQWLVDKNVRLIVRTGYPPGLMAGAFVRMNAILTRSPGAIVPDGFDFADYSRFQGVVAQGFATSAIEIDTSETSDFSLVHFLENRRTGMANRILSTLEQPIAGVAIALTTGQRQYMDSKTSATLRDAGLAHLLAISGLHMGLITGAAFFLFELIFAAVPVIALKVTPRKSAAIAAWGFGLFYLGMSGASVSTIRAFVMVSIGIVAVLTDRRVISLRSIAIAAFIILFLSPEAILASGFQMSFAATIGIVVAYEYVSSIRSRKASQGQGAANSRHVKKIAKYFAGAAGTSLIAQLAVAPIALYHFQAISLVGIVTNAAAIPLMAFVVMPAAFLSMTFAAIGLEAPFLLVMEQGLVVVISVAQIFTSWDFSVFRGGPYAPVLLIAAGLALTLVMLWRHKTTLALATAVLFVAYPVSRITPADVLVSNEGRVIGVHADGQVFFIGGRRGGFRDQAWMRYWSEPNVSEAGTLKRQCDSRGCITHLTESRGDMINSNAIATSKSVETTRYACSKGMIVFASYTHRRHCRGATLFLATEDIERYGPVGLWYSDNRQTIRYRWSNPPVVASTGN